MTKKSLIVVAILAVVLIAMDRLVVSLTSSDAAQDSNSPVIVNGMVGLPDGSIMHIRPKVLNNPTDAQRSDLIFNPSSLLDARERAEFEAKTASWAIIHDDNPSVRDGILAKARASGGQRIADKRYGPLSIIRVDGLSEETARSLASLRGVKSVVKNNLVWTAATTPLTTPSLTPTSTPSTKPSATPTTSPGLIMAGIVDTGISPHIKTSGGKNYSPGVDMSRFLTFMQPWIKERSVPVSVPPDGGWVNAVVAWPYFGGLKTSPNDIDISLKDETGAVIASAQTIGSVPNSERIEYFVTPSDKERQFTLTYSLVERKGHRNRLTMEVGPSSPGSKGIFWAPASNPTVDVSWNPLYLEARTINEVYVAPPGAYPSIRGSWKLGSFTLTGKTYPFVLSDQITDTVCYENDDPVFKVRYKIIGFGGFDSISIDTDDDGDYSDTRGTVLCGASGYMSSSVFSIDGVSYRLNEHYSTYDILEDYSIEPTTTAFYEHLTPHNLEVASLVRDSFFTTDGFGPSPNTILDFMGHGTHVAGIVRSVAPIARLYNAKVFGGSVPYSMTSCWAYAQPDGSNEAVSCSTAIGTTEFDIINGIEGAVGAGSKVINLSLGTSYYPPTRCEDLILSQYVNDLIHDRSIVVVAAAGNGGSAGSGSIISPACVEDVIAVGAVTTTDPKTVTSYSGRGPTYEGIYKPDLVAIGGDYPLWEDPAPKNHVAFLYPGGVSSRESLNMWSFFGYTNKDGTANIKLSGTSMAAPQVTGAVVRLLNERPDLSPAVIKTALTETATDLGFPPEAQGAGLLDVEAALAWVRGLVGIIPEQ